ncbi:uncharacterized protein LOC125225461 [Leguminivora glycinivorella]|uniref:uncharacterized protein LOC125225461 n=1 Tax=Leguminivora glycinivorella TaxID=1035111 RepID=UPI00200D4DF7|nr:uncharacterized protein LOC125225461 [Leguminivora glycinivorella]
MGGVGIEMTPEIKILGLTVDHKLTFNAHVSQVCKKAANIYKQLTRAARVNWGLSPEVIRTIYTTAVEPVILYAAAAWAPAARKLEVRKKFNAIQRGYAQKMCKAYRTASLNSTLILTGTLPLDLRLLEAASLYEAKKGISPQYQLADREVEKMAQKMSAPHPAEQTGLQFENLEDEEQYSRHSDYAVRIFTDGSKIEGKVGAALSIWKDAGETRAIKLTLSPYCTVYQAELLAITKATEVALKNKETSIGIYSDSRSALQSVTNTGSTHPLAVEARSNLRNCRLQNKNISLFWIKAHAGLVGNERADDLAKDAALKSKKRPEYDKCPISYIKREIRAETIKEWENSCSLAMEDSPHTCTDSSVRRTLHASANLGQRKLSSMSS